jgi:Flp pilus assembly protein TadG
MGRDLQRPAGTHMVTRRRGSVAVELGLTAPILAVILAGVLEWGDVLVGEVSLVQIARDAALAGARTAQADDPEGVARDRAEAAIAAAGYRFAPATITIGRTRLATGEVLDVAVQVPHTARVPFVPTPRTLRATTSARLEDQ